MIESTVTAFVDVAYLLARSQPGHRIEEGANGTILFISDLPLSTQNGVFAQHRKADAEEIAPLAAIAVAADLPWSIQLRGEPTEDVLKIAAGYGLTGQPQPLMVCTRDTARLRGPRTGAPVIRPITSAERDRYNTTLAAGFETPVSLFDTMTTAPLLDEPWGTAYLAELGGTPVATA